MLAGALAAAGLFSLGVGSVGIPLRRMFSLPFEGRGSVEYSILFDVRLPRILLGLAVGGALAISGVVLQGMFRNPLVEPYTLGISGGAALGVSLNIALKVYRSTGALSLPVSGFLGAVGAVLVVYSLGVRGGAMRLQRLLLMGVMISFICSSVVMLTMAVSKAEDLHGIIFWIMGSLEEPHMWLIRLVLGVSLSGLALCYLFAVDLNALSLGEEEAVHLGVNVERAKKVLFLLASLLTGFSVSASGVIGFVGLVVPHFVRMFVGGDHRVLLISSYLAGSTFLILCDTLARTIIAPLELPVGVITGMIGGSLFVYALSKRAYEF
ncbi:MAG TPA: iron ABC transporter permease [Candidatus Latescibacteria bacterium]|nr:iron ABC transporter permease [Candidatus Latescibacterota bacterium]